MRLSGLGIGILQPRGEVFHNAIDSGLRQFDVELIELFSESAQDLTTVIVLGKDMRYQGGKPGYAYSRRLTH